MYRNKFITKSFIFALWIILIGNVFVLADTYTSGTYPHLTTSTTKPYTQGSYHLDVNLLNQQPDPVEPGKYIEVRFNIENTGLEDAKNIFFEIEPQYPFSLDSGVNATKYIGTLFSGATGNNGVVVYYKLFVSKFAKLGTADIKIKYKVGDYDWIGKTFTLRIDSNQSLLSIPYLQTNPDKIRPGSDFNINLTLKNNGDDDLKNVIVNLIPVRLISTATGVSYEESVFSPCEDSTEKIIKNIEKGSSKTIEFKLIASPDAQLKPYKMPISIKYQDRLGNSYSKEIYAGLIVKENVDYSVMVETEDLLKENSKNKVYITISNKGKSKMNFVFVELLPSDDYAILSNPKIYLGNLDSDDEDNAEFEFFFWKYNQTKQIPINTKISYRDAYNNKYEESKQLSVNVFTLLDLDKYEGIGKKSNATIYIIVFAAILLLYWFWKRKKKHSD